MGLCKFGGGAIGALVIGREEELTGGEHEGEEQDEILGGI